MSRSWTCRLTIVLMWVASMLETSNSDVYTSSVKIKEMAVLEENILNNLQIAIGNLGNETALTCFSKFYQARLPQAKQRQNDPNLDGYFKHPNGVYHTIKQFARAYQHLRAALGSATPDVEKQLSSIADLKDLAGARLSFIRLQTVYNLSASDMVRGDYFGHMGPELDNIDALEIGEQAFTEGKLHFAIAWLNEALARAKPAEPSFGFFNPDAPVHGNGRIYALLGRSYLRQGDTEKAREMYGIARSSDPTDSNVAELGNELETKPAFHAAQDEDADFKRLCTLQNKLTKSKFDPRLVCSYKQVILPYYRFKMELVSVSPYVALFYDVISDFEGQTVIDTVRENLQRGRVESDVGNSIVKESRTSDLTFVEDSTSPVVARMSKRVAAITNLETKPYVDGSDFCSEPFQVVNYGMGGHYAMHFDAFDNASLSRPSQHIYNEFGGNRLATFLIYLTAVERGGSTVFPRANLAVSPVKNMALFWYTFTPSGERDEKTIHAGCPVIYGHKWVTNKWMWLKGNTFSRRCGLRPKDTQLNIDQHMRRGWA